MSKKNGKRKGLSTYLFGDYAAANQAATAGMPAIEDTMDEDDETHWYDHVDSGEAPKANGTTGAMGFGSGIPAVSHKPYIKCSHKGTKPEFYLDSERTLGLAGGTGSDVVPDKGTTLIVDLAGALYIPTPWVLRGPDNLAHLAIEGAPYPPVLRLAWKDQWPPDCDPAWFGRLYESLLKDYAPGNVIVACMGGHGRTGTMLASLLLVAYPGSAVCDIIDLVRSEHCEKSIESWDQAAYLMKFRPKAKHPKWLLDEAAQPKYKGYCTSTSPTPSKNPKTGKMEVWKDGKWEEVPSQTVATK